MSSTSSRIFLSPPSVSVRERAMVKRAFDSGYVAPCGPQVDEFERRIAKLAGRRYAVAVSSGTAAIDLVMAELGVDSSWTVIAPTLTFIATVGPAWHRGAKLVFVDSDATGNIDVGLLEEALAGNAARRDAPLLGHPLRGQPSAGGYAPPCRSRLLVIGVDLYGTCCDYDAIAKLCRRYCAVFVDDAAEAVGATFRGRPAGSAGLAGIFSFNGNKIITTSGGGAIVTDDRALAERAKKRSQQSREKCAWYEHREVGYNYRMSNILGALGIAQLDRLPSFLKKLKSNFEWYRRHFRGDVLVPSAGSNHWLTIGLLATTRERDALAKRLAKAGIESRPVWKPMHLQPVFGGCKAYGGEVAEALFARGICLPSGSDLSSADFRRIAEVL